MTGLTVWDAAGPLATVARRLLAVALVVAACGSTAPPVTPRPAPRSSVARAGACPAGEGPGEAEVPLGPPPSFALACLATVERGLAIAIDGDGSGRVFVASQNGQLWTIQDGLRMDQPLLDLANQVSLGPERGLLGLALHPRFPADPRLFIDYTDTDGNVVVASFRVDPANPDRALPDSETVILRIAHPTPIHNGGALAFGPDGDLYIGVGDGGSDPLTHVERLDTLLGKILRIDIDRPSPGQAYGVPADNPFVGRLDAHPEIWLLGLRNPWRFSFDRATGDLWIGDVGANAWEEVDVARVGTSGLNFGWAVMEGFHCYLPGEPCDQAGLTLPVAEYSHGAECAVAGGYVYRGTAAPALDGRYLFADYCSGRLFAISAAGDDRREPELLGQAPSGIAAFGEDEAGELYLANVSDGAISRLVATP